MENQTAIDSRPPTPTPPFQFTLLQLLIAMTWAAVGIALTVEAGVAGVWLWLGPTSIVALWYGNHRNWSPLIMAGICGLIVSFGLSLYVAIEGAHPLAKENHCANKLHLITLALQQYHTTWGCYPPPFIADADGKPMHSWRILLLPYLEATPLYRQYRFDEPWNGPNNRKLHGNAMKLFTCPAQDNKPPTCETNYVVVVGPKTAWPGGNSSVRNADIIDGLSNTLLVVEVANSGIHWLEPRDLHVDQMPFTINHPRGQGISSHHPGGANIALADGGVRFFTSKTPPKTIREILTRNGKEPPQSLDP